MENPIKRFTNGTETLAELKQKYARLGLSPMIEHLFAKSPKPKLHKDRKEGPIRKNVEQAVLNSIKNRWFLYISYEGSEEISAGSRYILPYTYGLHRSTFNHVLRAWQYSGTSLETRGEIPGWRLFRLDRINLTAPLTSKTFNKPNALFNPSDEDMGAIISVVSFPNA